MKGMGYKRFTIVICLLIVSLIVVAGCSSKPRVIGQNGVLSSSEKKELDAGLAICHKYISAWIARDFRALFHLQSKSSIDEENGYSMFMIGSAIWRDGFVYEKALHNKELPAKEKIIDSLRLVKNVSNLKAKNMLGFAVKNNKTLKNLKGNKWPERSMFISHELGSKRYVLMLVKEKGVWYVMNAPGTFEVPTGLENRVTWRKRDGRTWKSAPTLNNSVNFVGESLCALPCE